MSQVQVAGSVRRFVREVPEHLLPQRSYRSGEHAQRGEAGAAIGKTSVRRAGKAAWLLERVDTVWRASAGRSRQLSQGAFSLRRTARLGHQPAGAVFRLRDP